MKILIVGGGGREHALAWKAAQSPLTETVYVAPGNGGTAQESGVENVAIDAEDTEALLAFASTNGIDLSIVGPEAPLVAGLVDRFQAAGLRCFGPSAAAAQLEGSKAFAKDFLHRHEIPTAAYRTFTESEAALRYVEAVGAPLVIKADGLAAGKGVILAQDQETAQQAVRDMLGAGRFGAAGRKIVIEEWLQGEEASFMALGSKGQILPLASSQDHKARDEGDQGPNTGGMGAYSPAPVVTETLEKRILEEIVQPTVAGLEAEGIPYTGFLYAGLMIAPNGTPKVLEYNCRLGDPETQPLLMRLQTDLVELCLAALDGRLHGMRLQWDPRAALGVVLAAAGYPGDYAKGHPIQGLENAADFPDAKVFHAGTRLAGDQVVTAGGRVLCVTALGDSIRQAQERAYGLADRIQWEGAFYRRDIGHRALARASSPMS